MSWFTFNVGELAKSALSEAQKKIDKALDIEAKNEAQQTEQSHTSNSSQLKVEKSLQHGVKKNQSRTQKDGPPGLKAKKDPSIDTDDFFAAWGNEKLDVKPSPRSKESVKKPITSTSDRTKDERALSTPPSGNIGKLVMSDSDIEVITPGKYMSDDAALSDQSNTEHTTYETFTDIPLTDFTSTDCENIPVGTSTIMPNLSTLEELKQSDDISMIVPVSVPKEKDVEKLHLLEQPQTLISNTTVLSVTADHNDVSAVDTAVPSNLSHKKAVILSSDDASVDDKSTESICPDSVNVEDAIGERSPSALNDDLQPKEVPVTEKDVSRVIEDSSQETLHTTDCMEVAHDKGVVSVAINPEEDFDLKNDATTATPKSEAADQPIIQRADENCLALAEKMEVYEHQLMTLSQRNASLNEENDNLKSEISRTRDQCKRDVEKELTDAAESVKSLETACKILEEEKANLVKQFNVVKSQLAARMTHEQVQSAIAEKEESIKGLMEEGEVLAKKHLQQNNLIKKLKSQAQERESGLKSLKERVENYETENTKLKEELKIARGQGKEQRETSMRISDAYEQRERETQVLQEKLAQSEEKQRTLQVNLDGAYKEIGDLHKQIAEKESKLSSEWEAKESDIVRAHELDKKKVLSEQEHQLQLLSIRILELANSLTRVEANAARKDDDHRREVNELQQRIQESEERNQDLSDNVTAVTRPLLRQIENLQSTHSTQQSAWNALEKTLSNRLAGVQKELVFASENERSAQRTLQEAKCKVAALEIQIETNQKVVSDLEEKVASMDKQLQQRECKLKESILELDKLNAIHKETVHKSRKEKLFLENQLQMEKVRSEAEKKKHATQLELFQRERDKLMWSRSEITSVSSHQVAETESVSSLGDGFQGTDEGHTSSTSLPGLSNQLLFEDGRVLSISNVLENLQTQVKLREGEIAQLRGEINMLERTRSSMAEEIVRLTNLNEDMEGVSQDLQDTRAKLSDVESRYSAILTMYGEKEEENEELKMDLADVKAMYKQQINDLLKPNTS